MAALHHAPLQLLVFEVQHQRHAVALANVQRVVPAVAVLPLPEAPTAVLGAIDVAGQVRPVVSIRRRLGLPERGPSSRQQLVLARTAVRELALLVDEVHGVLACDATRLAQAAPGGAQDVLQGVVQLDDGLLLIHDLEGFLAPAQEHLLEAALRRVA
jgi:purine-binding chemotaxis protein CheW